MIDGVAFAPHRRVDVQALGTDLYALSLYKVYGPHLGLLYVNEALMPRLANQNHAFLAGTGSYTLMPGFVPHELSASIAGVVEYLEALDTHHGGEGTLDGAFARIAAHEERLAERLLSFLREHPRVRLIGEPRADRGGDRLGRHTAAELLIDVLRHGDRGERDLARDLLVRADHTEVTPLLQRAAAAETGAARAEFDKVLRARGGM